MGGDIVPAADGAFDLGSSADAWQTLYVEELDNPNANEIIVHNDILPVSIAWRLGSASRYWDQLHLKTGGLTEHSPRKFARPSRDLLRDIGHDDEGNIVVPAELQGDTRDRDGVARGTPGTRIGHLAYATADTVKGLVDEVEALEAENRSLVTRIEALEALLPRTKG